jgi:hypothetical protein
MAGLCATSHANMSLRHTAMFPGRRCQVCRSGWSANLGHAIQCSQVAVSFHLTA